MKNVNDILLRIAILAYCGWQAADLGATWHANPVEQWGWLAFGLWLLPAVAAAWNRRPFGPIDDALLGTALVLALVGQIAWVNAVQHVALMLALAGSVPGLRGRTFWLLAGVLWLPLTGWLCRTEFGESGMAIRLAGSTLASFALLWINMPPRFAIVRREWTIAAAAVVAVSLLTSGAARAETFTYSPVQSPARPFGLDIVDRVALAASDAASADFQQNTLPGMQELIDRNLGERVSITDGSTNGLIALDPTRLTLSVASDVRAYFLGEGAGYQNSFGFNTSGGGITSGDPLLIFPNASSANSYLSSGTGKRTTSEPLMPGDFVELGSFAAGEHLDFFLIANGAKGGSYVYSTDSSVNPDGIDHVVAFAEVESPYLLIGFEDLFGGGDQDYNDLLVALYVGEANVQALIQNAAWSDGVPAPEPASIAFVVAGFAAWLYRRRRLARAKRQARP